jgi:hypothetical protein
MLTSTMLIMYPPSGHAHTIIAMAQPPPLAHSPHSLPVDELACCAGACVSWKSQRVQIGAELEIAISEGSADTAASLLQAAELLSHLSSLFDCEDDDIAKQAVDIITEDEQLGEQGAHLVGMGAAVKATLLDVIPLRFVFSYLKHVISNLYFFLVSLMKSS